MSVCKSIPLGFPSFSKDIVGCSEVMARQEVAGTPKYLLCPLFNEVCAKTAKGVVRQVSVSE